ncbi:MAG: orotidine-5'-phosphate decarboxylase [Balneolaceae bacterium]
MTFIQKLNQAVRSSESHLCIGLDPRPELIPEPFKKHFSNDTDLILNFCRQVIEATKPYCCAYKPNTAFFEAYGSKGWRVLEDLVDSIPPGKIIIADAKRGDIGSTAQQYKKAFFDHLNVDAITLNPFMGFETLDPFLEEPSKAIFVLTATSNPGAADFLLRRFEGRMTMASYITEHLAKMVLQSKTHIGLVAGATHPDTLKHVTGKYPDASLLIPGIGSQGGSIEELSLALKNHMGIPIVSSSRSILYAGKNDENWLEKIAEKAALLQKDLNILSNE